MEDEIAEDEGVFRVPRPPPVMLTTCHDASFLITDTGCQRQVAGSAWHMQKISEILPLQRLSCPEACKFSFGPGPGLPGLGRHTYPAGIAGHCVMLSVSEVDASAPGLLSRRALETLGAVPDLVEGQIIFKALNGSKTKLYLSPCGHLALKIDEWPSREFEWPLQDCPAFPSTGPPDVWCKGAFSPKLVKLESLSSASTVHPPPHASAPRRSTLMASSVAGDHGALDRVHGFGAEHSSALRCHKPTATPQGQHPEDLHYSEHGVYNVEHSGGHGSSTSTGTGQVHEGPGELPASLGTQELLGFGDEDHDLRCVRLQGSGESAHGSSPTCRAQGEPRRKDSFESVRNGKGQGPARESKRASAGSTFDNVPRLLSALLSVIAGIWSISSGRTQAQGETEIPHAGDGILRDGLRHGGNFPPMASYEQGGIRLGEDECDERATAGSSFPDLARSAALHAPTDRGSSRSGPSESSSEPGGRGLGAERLGAGHRGSRGDRGGGPPVRRRGGVLGPLLHGSPDEPLGPDDQGCFALKQGVRKRLLGSAKSLNSMWEAEAKVYELRAQTCRRARCHKIDVFEVHAGPFELSNKALASKMKVLRPSGMFPKDKEHLLRLREIILKWKPFLVVWVLPGHVSSSVLEALSRLLAELQLHDVHYLLGGLDLLSVEQRSCFFGSGSFPPLRAGCVTDLVELQGILETDQVLGSHSPRPLPCGPGALIQGLCEALCRAGDERFCTSSRAWACSIDQWDLWRPSCSLGPNFRAYFLDVTRHEDSWRPLLREAEARLRDLVSTTVTLKSSPYLEQIKALVPWELRRVQICRTPKQRRAPTDLIADGVKHRGASLLMNDGNIVIEAEAMKSVVNAPNTRYDKPVQIGIFFYGTAPDTSLNEEENLRPEPPRPTGQVRQDSIEPNDIMQPHQAGYRDISFPGATDLPRWMANVLRQLHTNLGHPAKEILVRQLVLAGASPQAVKGARCLQCKVCRRVQPPREPRPARAFYPRRFNDRLYMDIVFLKDIQGTVYSYLSCVDDATCYHAAQYLPDRQEMTVLRVFLSGWLTFFGPPDELVLDAEGAFKGLRFETLQVQTGTKLRYVPADAHWQLGRAERHGQALRYVCSRLVSQFAPTTVQEMNLCVTMAIHAKNTLIRRAGSSPCQWVFGRNPKLPASLLSDGGSIEACQLTSDSDRLQLVERIRTEAMVQHHRFEADQGLRTALLRKSRPHRGHLDVGQKVAYYRAKNSFDGEGSVEGYRQGTILALDEGVTGNVWVKNNRGRIVQVAREQCRPVAGEEEWWSPDQLDLQLLKNSDQDLLPAEVPGFSALRARPPNDAAVLRDRQGQVEQQPGPLDADGNPVASPAMMNPVLLVPPTPRAARAAPSTPTIPATPSSSAAPLQNPAMPTARSATIEPSLPALQAVPEDTALVPLPEPTPLASESPLESRRASGSVVGQDASSTPLASESHLESRRASGSVLGAGLGRGGRQSSSESSTGLSKELTKLLHQEYPEFRGIKRGPSVSVEDLSEGPNASRRTPQGPTTSEMTVIPDQLMDNVNPEPPLATFLLFCQDCGDQNRRLDHGTDVCARCNSARKVESPLQVSSWFDEVQERDALDRHFKVVKPEATGTETEPGAQRHEQEDFRATSFSTTCTTSPTSFNPEPLRRLDVLHRHARGDQRLPGWDGSPNEVHLYQSCNFLTAAHHFGDHRDKRQLRPPRAPSLSETTARKLLEAGDFRHSSCHQLLDTVKFTGSSRDCLYNNDGSSAQTLVLGLYSHGSFSGCTRATKHNKWLCRYLNDYLRSWGQWGTTTSLSISRNSGALPHRDVHNAKGSLNWLVSFGSHKGGRTWVETDRADAHTVNKIHKGNTYPGYVVDSRHNLVSFAPDRLHSTEPFTGDRWSLTAYTSRSVSYATEADKAKLDRLGFTPRMRRSTAFPVDYVQANDSEDNIDAKDGRGPQPAWVHQPVYKAYPTYASAKNADYVEGTPEQEYHIGIEQSSEDGDDGTFEASRAARQAEKKELPWRSMSATEVPAFREALRAEWAEWTKWSSCVPVWTDVSKIPAHLILKSRVCYRWKPKPDGSHKPKARIVVAGFRDPHLPLLTRDAPVLSRAGFACLLQWACSHKVKLWNGDCRSAFLQGKPDNERPEPIFMRPPTDPVAIGAIPEWNSEQLLFKLSAPVYGQSNAPRRWYLHVADKLSGLGWVRHTLDPCLWMRLSPDTTAVCSVLGLHVDDVILATLPGTEDHLHEVEKAFEWGGPWEHSDFTFIGRRIKQHEDGSLTVDQANYVAEVPPTKITLDPETPLGDHPDLITEYRSGIGSLQWLASTTRADVAADVSLIQKAPSDLKVQDLMEINSVLRYIRATNEAGYKVMPIDLNELVFVAYADSGFANAPGHRSQGGLVIVATDKKVLTESRPASLLEWKSFRHQRVLRSTLAAEAASLDRSVDHAFFLASMFSELTDGNFKSTAQERPLYEVLPVTDVRSLWDAIHRLSTNFQEKRVEIDIAGLRQSCRTLRWVPTEEQKADALTKRSRLLRDSFRMFMANPVVTLVQSRSPEEMAGEKANAAWR